MNKQTTLTKFTIAIFGAMALASSGVAMAGSLTVTNTFSSGQAASAAQVNQNFADVKTAVDDNDGRIITNTGNVTTNTTGVGTNAGNITTNTGNITTNTTGVSTNASNLTTHTAVTGAHHTKYADGDAVSAMGVAGNANTLNHTRYTDAEAIAAAGGGGGGDQFAVPVTVNCPSAGAIQAAIDGAAPHGRLTITINGACSENININRRKVTLLGGAGDGTDSIVGATTSPTITNDGKRGLVIDSLTIGGGLQAVFATKASKTNVKNSTIGDGSTLNGGMVVAFGSLARFNGGTGGIIINGGITSDESAGLQTVGNSTVQFESGTTTINNGNLSAGLVCELAGSLVVGGFANTTSTLTVNGSVELVENCYLGMFNGAINGEVRVSNNSTLTIEAFTGEGIVVLTGNVNVDSSSSALIDGDTASIAGNVTVQRSSVMNLRSGATVNGNVQVRASSGLDIQPAAAVISGVLECDTFTGNYLDIFPQSTNVAGSYLVDGMAPMSGDVACGFVYP